MIKTSTQLKAKVRNLSAGDNDRAKLLIRNFIMERFLEDQEQGDQGAAGGWLRAGGFPGTDFCVRYRPWQ